MAEALSKQDETQQDMLSDGEYDGTENKTVLSYVQAFQWGGGRSALSDTASSNVPSSLLPGDHSMS